MTINDSLISSEYVQVNGLNIHYLAAGEGEPVVLLHGLPTFSYLWRKIIEPLAKTRRVIAPDLPGFGQSDKPLQALYTFDYLSGVFNRFLHGLGVKQTALVVHDLGGPVGLLWAVRNPEKVERLIILDTVVHPSLPRWVKLSLLMARVPGLRNWLVSPSGIAMIMRWGVENKEVMTKKVIANYQAPFATAKARQVLLKAINNPQPAELEEISQKLSTLRVPIHIIYGEKDFMIASEMRRLKQELPAARHTVIPNCGHFLQEDQPERLSELLVEFLSE